MSRNIRDRRQPNKRVVHLTNRCWEGLPFVPNVFLGRLLDGVMARAQTFFPVHIVCYLFMGNHYHLIIAGDANRVSGFANYLDGEIAKRMMRMIPGRWGAKFWQGRFKEQHLPTIDAVVNKIAYIFCNPLRARLVSDLSSYPGASSLRSLSSPEYKTAKLCSITMPKHYPVLEDSYISRVRDRELALQQQEKSKGFFELKTDLFCWTKCFPEKRDKRVILAYLRGEIALAEKRAAEHGVIGPKRLMSQPLDRPHRPGKRPGDRTPYIDCPNPQIRKIYIEEYRGFQEQCRRAWQLAKKGSKATWPLGAFIPSMSWSLLVLGQGT